MDINIVETIKKADMETLTQKIKGLPSYGIYEKAVKEKGRENTATLLQAATMLSTMTDKKLAIMMHSVSLDLLFAMIDQKLRNEILSENEGGYKPWYKLNQSACKTLKA